MKRFLTAVGLCGFLFTLGMFVLLPTSKADGNILLNLLNLPAPPPPNPAFQIKISDRSAEFYDQNNPPKDNAPIEDLMDYWARQSQIDAKVSYALKPSEETLGRIKAEIEKDPERLLEFLNSFAENDAGIEFVKRLYEEEVSNKKFGREWRDSVKRWLTFNSPYFSDELLKAAQQVKDTDEYVTNQDELLALAKVDWDKARPILERLLNDDKQPVSQTLARWAFYQHALDTGDSSEAERFRRELQRTVENKTDKPGNRDLAMDALVRGGDFSGRDEWYLKLLEDESLLELKVGGQTYTGLTTIINHSPPEKYTARMLELLKSDSKAVRSAAVRNLALNINIKNPEVVKALLPWLENPKWADDINNSRRNIVNALKEIQIPESVPGLIALLNEKESRNVNQASNTNGSVPVSPPGETNFEYRTYVYEAMQALATQKDARAVPALRAILPELEGWQKQIAVTAILKSGGFSASEQVEAVEIMARGNVQNENEAGRMPNAVTSNAAVIMMNTANMMTNSGMSSAPRYVLNGGNSPLELKLFLGMQLVQEEEPGSELVAAMIDRIGVLDAREPSVARAMRNIMRNWRGAAVNALLLRDLRDRKSETADVVKLLSRRKELREKQFNDIYSIRSGSALAHGISACLLEDAGEYDAILSSENNETKTAVLACARLIRARLPIQKVAENLRSADKLVAVAAEKYLESEDSPEARSIVLSLHSNEAKILGARTYFGSSGADTDFIGELFASVYESPLYQGYFFGTDFSDLEKVEKKLQKEVLENAEILGVYSYNGNFVRIYKDKAVFSWQEDPARFRERVLDTNEFERLKNYLASQRVDELPPFLSYCGEEGCEMNELLMLGRGGGRRVFVQSANLPTFFAELEKIFEDMRRPPAKLRYYLQNNFNGLEILFENEKLQAETVWKNGADFRVLINNEARREQIEKELEQLDEADEPKNEEDYEKVQERSQKRREMRAFENFAWHRFDGTKLLENVSQPAPAGFIPPRDGLQIQPDQQNWKARTPAFELRANDEGLFKVARGQMTKIRAGFYEKPLVTPNGRWAVAKKYGGGESEEEAYGIALVRVNLLTGKEFKVQYKQYPPLEPIVYVASLNKVLLATASYSDYEEAPEATNYRTFFWLDAETGAFEEAKGLVKPLAQQTFRPLQPVAAKPDEFWAAVPDAEKNHTQIGTFNSRTLVFKSLLTLPEIQFDSMKMWIDETEHKAYFAYQGHLLALPLPK